jgi:hypothetical protein
MRWRASAVGDCSKRLRSGNAQPSVGRGAAPLVTRDCTAAFVQADDLDQVGYRFASELLRDPTRPRSYGASSNSIQEPQWRSARRLTHPSEARHRM